MNIIVVKYSSFQLCFLTLSNYAMACLFSFLECCQNAAGLLYPFMIKTMFFLSILPYFKGLTSSKLCFFEVSCSDWNFVSFF